MSERVWRWRWQGEDPPSPCFPLSHSTASPSHTAVPLHAHVHSHAHAPPHPTMASAAVTYQSPLLWVPLKQTEDVDISTAVRSVISASYGEDPKHYSSSLNALARARTDAVRGGAGGAGSDAVARDLLFKWFHILEMLEVRFPELRVPFTWKDAFTGKGISQFSLAYEKAGVIFNTAATLSSLAAAVPRLGGSAGSAAGSTTSDGSGVVSSPVPAHAAAGAGASAAAAAAASSSSSALASTSASAGDSDGTKRAYTALRQAAGFFSYISDNFLHAPSTDMSRALLRFVIPLLLTQANEVFLERTLGGGKSSPGLVAKLASGVALGYTSLAEESKEWTSKEVVDRTWNMLLSVSIWLPRNFNGVVLA